MSSSRNYLSGHCTLESGAERFEQVYCYLDLEERRLVCELEQLHGFGSVSPNSLNRVYAVSDIELWGPSKKLKAERFPVAFVSSVSGGTWSVGQTPLRHSLGIHAQVGRVCFIANEPIQFVLEEEANELMLKPGLDTAGLVDMTHGLRLSGTKETISLLGETELDEKDLSIATALSIGCPCQIAARQKGRELTLFLNNFSAAGTARPLFARGHPMVDPKLQAAGLKSIFELTIKYLLSLRKQDSAAFRNSVYMLLQARSVPSSYELQLYAAFHFLELFDGSRTLSPNVLVDRLGITRKEADVIKGIRDALAHNNRDLAEVIEAEAAELFQDSSLSAYKYRGRNTRADFLNFLMSLLGERLLRRIGYEGKADSYFPIIH